MQFMGESDNYSGKMIFICNSKSSLEFIEDYEDCPI